MFSDGGLVHVFYTMFYKIARSRAKKRRRPVSNPILVVGDDGAAAEAVDALGVVALVL